MKKLFPLMMLFLFAGCSWEECFVVKNNSNSSVVINYKLSPTEGMAIFYECPMIHNLNSSGHIDRSSSLPFEDLDTTIAGLSIVLPPHTILSIGELNNDTYKKHDQQFINGRVFNFVEMGIRKKEGTTLITKLQFDDYFKKKDGFISYDIE